MADWTEVLGDPEAGAAFDESPRWRFVRRDWSLKDPKGPHPAGVSSVRAAWCAQVWTATGRFGPLLITNGVFQRASESKAANSPTLRFAGRMSATSWDIQTSIGRLFVRGPESSSLATDPATASARAHRPLMTLASTGFASALSSLDIPLLLLRSDLAPEGCDFSEFTFAPTGIRAVYDKDVDKARTDLRASDSYLWLGDPAVLRELPLANLDLTRARIDVARPDDLARLGFMFSGLHLEIANKQAWIADARASCRVRQRIEPSGNGEPIVLDTRPVLVAEFPPQHVFEEAVFRPSDAPLPDVVVKDPTFNIVLAGAKRTFSTFLPELLLQLEGLACVEDHVAVRQAYQEKKKNEGDDAFNSFVEEFGRLCTAGMADGSLPSPAKPPAETPTCSPRIGNESPATAYWVYIGSDGMPPELMAIGRAANKTTRSKFIEALLKKSLANAEGFIDLLLDKAPTPEQISSKIIDVVKSVIAALNPFKSTPELPISPLDHARMLEQATSGVMQDYAYFRDFYAEWMLLNHGAEGLPPEQMEYFSPNSSKDLTIKDPGIVKDRVEKATAEYVLHLQNQTDPEPVMRARLSGTSRLAFHVDCGSRPRMDVEDGDAQTETHGSTTIGTRLPFSFDALTDWAHYDLAVTPRARQTAAFDEAGVLMRREAGEEVASDGDSPGADIAMLRSLGIRSGQSPQRPQGQGRPRDWGKKLRTLRERLTDVEASLSVVPDDLQTAIEIPARLILSPSQKGQWRTRRDNLGWACAPSQRPIPLWSANLEVDAINPLVRAVASPDMRPEFVRFALERSLFAHQRAVLKNALHTPAGAAPPRGPRAPWTLGFEESDPNATDVKRLFEATRSVPVTEDQSENIICAASSAATAAASAASGAQSLHPLVDYLCSRQIDHKGYGKNAVFRSTLDAYDRHEIVVLSSTWGLPVRGRREKTGQLQALRFSSQVELPEEWRLLDAQAGTAIYRPRALKIQELALTALGGTLRHDSDFIPPAAARHIVHGPLFDSLSVERWQHWTVLGRDVFAEVVYKGYLFPIGHRASLVKQTERVFLRPAAKDGAPSGPVRCYLRQRMFIRIARPDKAFPAYGQPNGGRMFPADVVRMLTLTTPDIVDPTEDTKQLVGPAPSGRLYANEAGLVFWPRTARLEGTDVIFDMQIQDAATRGKLIFVDNVAVNRADLMERLVKDYNALGSPDLTSNRQVDLQTPDLQKHLRTLDLRGHSLRYCDEIKPGSASHKTLSWTLKATGGVGGISNNDYEGPVSEFDDPLLEGADQPAFFPAIETARIRIDQVERLTAGGPQVALAQFEGWYVQNGFEPNKGSQESDKLGVYVNIVNKVTMDMGNSGDRSGGVMRPAGEVIALSRERGPLTGTGRITLAGAIASVVGGSGFPLTQPETKVQRAVGPGSTAPDQNAKSARKAFDKFFSGNETLNTKILGLVSVKDLVTYLNVKDAAAELPLLREVVEYGMSGVQAAGEALRTNVIAPLYQMILGLSRQWEEAGKIAQASSEGFVSGMGDVFPDVNNALRDLKTVLSAASVNTDDAAVLASLSDIYECGRRLMDACGRVASNPLDQLQVALKRKLEGLSGQLSTFWDTIAKLDAKQLETSVYGALTEFESRLLNGVFVRLRNIVDKLQAIQKKLGEEETETRTRVEAMLKVCEVAGADVRKALQDAIDSAPVAPQAPLTLAEGLLGSLLTVLVAALAKVQVELVAVPLDPASDAGKMLRSLGEAVRVMKERTAEARSQLSSTALLARSEYRRASSNLATLLRLFTMVRNIAGKPEAFLMQVSQILFDYLLLQVGPRLPNPPTLAEAQKALTAVLAPIEDSAKGALESVAAADLAFPSHPLPDLTKKNALDKGNWPVTGNGSSLVEKLQAVAKAVHKALLDEKLKGPEFEQVRSQLEQLGKSALDAQIQLHLAAVGVRLVTDQTAAFDVNQVQVSMQKIDSAFSELEKLSDSAVLALARMRDDLVAISQKEVREQLTLSVQPAILSILDWFFDLNAGLQVRVSKLTNESLQPLLAPWQALLTQYGLSIAETRKYAAEANSDDWQKAPSKLLPVLRDPRDAAKAMGIQAVITLQRTLTELAMDWVGSLVEPAEAMVSQLMTVFRPVIQLLNVGYKGISEARDVVFAAAGKSAGQLLTGALLVSVDRTAIFVTGALPSEADTDASLPTRDQLHWDMQSMTNLAEADLGKLSGEERVRALNFMDYLTTGWRTGQSTPLRIVNQLRRISLEEIRARLLALINFSAIREEIEERIKLLIPSAMTLSYDFATTMTAKAEKATAGVFRPKEGCALTVRTRARIDLLKPSAPSFLSIGELGAFDIRLLGSFDAVTLHFKGVRFVSRGGAPECDLQYDGFTIGKEMEYLSQLTPFFGSKAGSGFYLQPLSSGIGLEAGYGLNLGTFTVGNLAIFNVSLNAAARLPFDDRGATFVASLSRRDSPFTIAIAPYGGSGFFALEADTKGIVGFEASFEYGGAGAFQYGPLKGQGRLMVGAYIRSRRDHTEIFATFYVGGSASIWIFNFGASLYVTAKQEGSQMKGSATYTFSFSMGIVDYDYSVAVNVNLSLDGSSDDKSQKDQAEKQAVSSSSQDEMQPVRLASLDIARDPGGTVSDVAGLPIWMMAAVAAAATQDKQSATRKALPATPKRRVETKCQTQSWKTYSNYFDNGLKKSVNKEDF